MGDQIVLFESEDSQLSLDVRLDAARDTVWLTQAQMAELFGRSIGVISRHISNALNEGEIDEGSNLQKMQIPSSDRPVTFYNLDVVISVGYRVKSKRGVEFRRWATGVLRKYILQGHAENERRLKQLGQIVQVMGRAPELLGTEEILQALSAYTHALDLLDDYDHQCIAKPEGRAPIYVLGYDECRKVIDGMRFSSQSELFGVEKDESFKSSVAVIYQSFGEQELYPSLEEKAANLLYLVVKNHSFLDGNKRIAAAIFLYFLHKNDALYPDGQLRLTNNTLAALTIMIAESKPEEKEAMVALAMSFLVDGEA